MSLFMTVAADDAGPPARVDTTGYSSIGKMDSTRTPTKATTSNDDAVDVDAALAMMKQSARQLDELLQRVCATTTKVSEDGDDGSTEARAVGAVEALGGDAPVSCEAYFQAIRTSLASPQRVNHEELRGLFTSEHDVNKTMVLDDRAFTASTADVTYMFPAPTELYATNEDDDGRVDDQWDMAEALRLDEFQQLMVQCLETTDHAMPAAVGDAIAAAMAKELVRLSGNNCELRVIETLFPVKQVQPDTHVEWRRGNRICKVQATERARRRQWGLEVTLTLETVARAQGLTLSDVGMAFLGPPLNCAIECRTFVPKAHYKVLDPVVVTTALSISLGVDGGRDDSTHSKLGEATASETDDVVLPEFLNVYQCGGHADLSSRESSLRKFDGSAGFQLLDIPTPFPRNRIVQAACGRLHTLLLNDMGMVFSYGHAMDGALGHGDALGRTDVFIAEPRLVEFFLDKAIAVQSIACGGDDLTGFHSAAVARDGRVYTWGIGMALGLGSVKNKSTPERVTMPRVTQETEPQIASFSCGSGFCIALDVDGRAFAWGKWSDGRLGLGAVPILHKSARSRRQLQRFQLYPKHLEGTRWRKVSCGDTHSLALSTAGVVYVWGRGRQGQLGLGDVRDAITPVPLSTKTWIDIAAGQDWSMAVDAHGAVWSWGACGAAVLGLSYGDDADRSATIADVLLQKHLQLRQQQPDKYTGTRPPRFRWLRPQPIPSLAHSDAAIRRISAGARHAAAISERGDLYVWGSPQQGLSPTPTLVVSAGIGSTIAERVFCGGSQIIALTSGSFLARAMRQLYTTLQVHSQNDADSESQPPAGADVALLVGGGHALFAHKLVLCRRSPVLRSLILNEERPVDAIDTGAATPVVTEILLPQLRVDIARILLEFLYTDNLSTSLDPLSYLIRDVLRAAREFEIPLLVRICRTRIASASYVPLGTLHVDLEGDGGEEEGDAQERHSLNDDLAFAFGDATWSDLRIVAEHRAIPVHRCILTTRSDYFRALMAFEDQQHSTTKELEVDESYVGMLRVLNFIYHDELRTVTNTGTQSPGDIDADPDNAHTEQLLEDLIAADKFGLVRLKRLCEHHIVVTETNCLDVLVVADLVHAEHLKHVAMAFVQTHLHMLSATSMLPRLAHEFPHLLTELYDRLHLHTQQQTLLRDWQRRIEADVRAQHAQQNAQWEETQAATSFPWVPLVLALVFATLYLTVMNAHESDYPLVPAINMVVIGGLLVAAFAGKV